MTEQVKSHDQEYIEELESLLTIAKHSKVIALLKSGLADAKSAAHKEQTQSLGLQSHSLSKDKQTSATVKIKEYGWDQTDKFVKIYITKVPNIEQISSENVGHQFLERSFTVEVSVERKVYVLAIKNLLNTIIPEQSSVKIKSGMVCVHLRKKVTKDWECLLVKEKKVDTEKGNPQGEDEDPGAGLMKLMKKMYDEGDDEMKRTISKSWYEAQHKRNQGMDDFPM